MLSAVKCKQNVDPALADALDGTVADMSKMYMKLDYFGRHEVMKEDDRS